MADVLELANRKDAAGERLMQQMSKPHPAGHDDPRQLAQLGPYCKQDVEIEREVHGRVPPLSAEEQMLWVLSCRINQRGFHFDPIICRSRASDCTGRGARDRCRDCRS